MFAGIGGFHLALHSLGGKCVFACEIDKFARITYEANFKSISPGLFENGNFPEDITKVDATTIPDFDILCAGFPCQAFSVAGMRKGFNDPRGQLFFEIIKILKAKQPKAFILENVRGLVSHNNGETFERIIKALRGVGYDVHYKVLKACDYGLPQFRPRVYIVGFKHKTLFTFPDSIPLAFTLSDVFKGHCTKDIAYMLTVKGLGRYYGDPKCIDMYLVDGAPRRIGIPEARQLMGFPELLVFPVSKTQAMKQLGNSVAVSVVKAVTKSLLSNLVE